MVDLNELIREQSKLLGNLIATKMLLEERGAVSDLIFEKEAEINNATYNLYQTIKKHVNG